jgi:acyl-CoA synthetase (AMP-forming)/AMP-acid ligase II
VTTISFDIAVLELFLPLIVGARVEIVSRDELVDGDALARLLTDSHATVLQATPSLWRILLEADWSPVGRFRALCGGEPFPVDVAESLCERCDEVWNMYGPTETTVWSACERILNPVAEISIGRPIGNTRIYILDDAMQLVPVGTPGELWIGGDGVAIGYLNRNELTRERFVPTSLDPAGRIYRTGDHGKWLPDGRIAHLGRIDSQVKVRGFRIELGEIEQCLLDDDGVVQASVRVWDSGPADRRLVAYLTVPAEDFSATKLRKRLRRRLPEYMIPQHFVTLERLPLTPNGKIDKNALPPPFGMATEERQTEPLVTRTEEAIAEVWRKVLGDVTIGRSDNFFDVGGHSLLAIKASALVEEKTGWRPTPRMMILEQLAEIAAKCDEETATRPALSGRVINWIKSKLVGSA